MLKLLADLPNNYFREQSDSWIERFDYKEAGPQLLLQAFCNALLTEEGGLIANMA